MVSPVPSHPRITTAYRVPGRHWARGYHTGVDLGSPGISGATVVATTGGVVSGVGASWGAAYGDRQVVITAPDGTRHLYAHMSRADVAYGQKVTAGQRIGTVGARGNVTGPHLHYEVRKAPHTYGADIDPGPYITGSGGSGGGPVTYLSKLRFGQQDSDSVRNLQRALNRHKMPGGRNLPITGNYGPQTDQEVRLCQRLHGYGSDAPGKSSVGPRQAAHLGLPGVRP